MTTKKYVITDPGYILHQEWSELCKVLDENRPWEEVGEEFRLAVEMKLKEVSGDAGAWAADTIIGDWTNVITGPDVIQPEFGADGGMVCVCELTDIIQQRLKEHKIPEGCYGVFEAEGPLSINAEGNNMLVIEITDYEGNQWTTLPEDEDDDCEYEEEDYD